MNFIFIALAVASKKINQDHTIILLIINYILFNSCSNDAFSSVDLFPGLLRFDSLKKGILLYRLSGTSFLKRYNTLIWQQRLLGIPEFIIMFVIYILILSPTIYQMFFGMCISLFNFIISPHLSTISSFIFPHFNYQHFAEMDEFIEDEFIIDKIGYKFKEGIALVMIVLTLFLIFFDISFKYIYLCIGITYIISSIIVSKMIKSLLIRREMKYDRQDIL
ncbi:hypothetical protein LI034_12450 [Clostridium perfringens]|uniref:hypothetical protein n=1 Tax=Clostridium perfringens TaxID=1502 RepID=UPI0022455CFC|nr:hypothetical protein [Clostridium perfringens]MCX0361812.1 hypothetical protein [Clostridium perfringens]